MEHDEDVKGGGRWFYRELDVAEEVAIPSSECISDHLDLLAKVKRKRSWDVGIPRFLY